MVEGWVAVGKYENRRAGQWARGIVWAILGFVCSSANAELDAGYSRDAAMPANHLEWMTRLPNYTRLSDISIPGTSHSMAQRGSDREVSQTASLATQLDAGIRALDIRVDSLRGQLLVFQGSVYQGVTFDEVLDVATGFLKKHPGEIILMQVSEENTDALDSSPVTPLFVKAMKDPRWSPTIWTPGKQALNVPQLVDVRGKIVIFQGLGFTGAIKTFDEAPSVNRWVSAQPESPMAARTDMAKKWQTIKNQLVDAATAWPAGIFHINRLNAAPVGDLNDTARTLEPYFVASGQLPPPAAAQPMLLKAGDDDSFPDFPRGCVSGAKWSNSNQCGALYAGMNQLALDYIKTVKPNHVGIVRADFPSAALIDAVIALNSPAAPLFDQRVKLSDHRNFCMRLPPTGPNQPGQLVVSPCASNRPDEEWVFGADSTIRWAGNPERCVDLAYSDTDPRSAVGIYLCHGGDNQKWLLKDNSSISTVLDPTMCITRALPLDRDTPLELEDCRYDEPSPRWFITSVPMQLAWGDNQCLSTSPEETGYGFRVMSSECVPGALRQQWSYRKEDNSLRHAHDQSQCLLMRSGPVLAPCNGNYARSWTFLPDGSVRARDADKRCLTAPALNAAEMTADETAAAGGRYLYASTCEPGSVRQHFTFGKTATSLVWGRGKCLDVRLKPAVDGSDVVSWDCGAAVSAAWLFRGDHTVRSAADPSKCLSLFGDNAARASTRLVSFSCTGSAYQQWSALPDGTLRPRKNLAMCAQVNRGLVANGAPAVLAPCVKGEFRQRFGTPRTTRV